AALLTVAVYLAQQSRQRAREAEATSRELEHEVAERQRAEEALQRQASILRQQAELIDLAHDAIIIRDADHAIIHWNHGAADIYGWISEQALGQIIHIFLQTRHPIPLADLHDILLTEGYWEGELLHHRADGALIIVESRQVMVRDENGTPT